MLMTFRQQTMKDSNDKNVTKTKHFRLKVMTKTK